MSRPPDPLPWLYRWRTNLIQTPFLALITAVCGSISLLISFVDKSGRMQHRIARVWARLCVWISGSKVTVRGAENLGRHPVAVYASNHTSYMDTPVIFAALPFQFRILAKKELWPIAFIGWYLGRSGQIPIDTANPHATLSSLGVGVKALRGGMPLFVFPEGGRTATGELRPFLSGAAYLAVRAQAPLVPIALTGVYDLLPIHTHHFYPGELTLSVGEPIETKGKTVRQTEELTAELRAAIAEMLDAKGAAADGPIPVIPAKSMKAEQHRYTVLVDDNFHYTDESERYTHGTYTSLEAAIEACKEIVDDFLEHGRKEGPITGDELYEGYVACGPDPFIETDDPAVQGTPFSAWTYAREQCSRRAADSGQQEAGR